MIKMIKSTYGLVKADGSVEAMTPASGPFSVNPKREAELIALGVAVAVEDPYEGMKMGDLRKLADCIRDDIKYKALARFPAVVRDISLVMKKTVLAGQIEEIIRKNGGKILEDFHLFDIYEGENVADDEKSLAYSITFRAGDRTLEDKDVTEVMDKILKNLEQNGIVLRS